MSETELPRDEDSVSSLANLAIKNGLVTFAGINSAPADIASGKNEHLRSFEIIYPAKRRNSREQAEESEKAEAAQGTMGLIGKAALFAQGGPKSEVYQRIIRLSPVQRRDTPSKRIGAVATGLGGTKNEIVVFDATFSEPAASHVVQRIVPAGGAEAADLAITELQKELFSLVYCTDHDVYAIAINYDFESERPRGNLSEPRAIYTIPQPHAASKLVRPTFRALRFLTSEYLLLLQNLPGRTGAELLILRLFPSTSGEIVARRTLPRRIKAATGLDVCVLDADGETGARQIVIAVIGQDITVEVMTIDYLGNKQNALGKFHTFITLRDVHPHQMTGVVFAPFHAPRRSSISNGSGIDGSSRNGKSISQPSTPVEKGPQFLRLATVSMGNTVVVDHFQLTEVPTSSSDSVRYVLSTARARLMYSSSIVLLVSAIALVSAVLLQAVLGASSQGIGGSLSVQDGIRSLFHGPRAPLPTISSSSFSPSPSSPSSPPQSQDPSLLGANTPLRTLFSQRLANTQTPNQQQAIILRPRSGSRNKPDSNAEADIDAEIHTNLETFLHENTARTQARLARAEAKAKAKAADQATKSTTDEDEHETEKDGYITDTEDNDDSALVKPWEELSEHDRSWWTERLKEAGAWAVEEGEAVLNGVFFSEIGPRAAHAALAAGANVAAVVDAAAGDQD